jgi:hypothetical protein
VPFIRYTKDKRGYESTYVMHAYRPAQGPPRTRVLYLFRSPPHVRVGRKPLDEETREALAHTHPDLAFDWSSLGRDVLVQRQEHPGRSFRDRDRDRAPERGRDRERERDKDRPRPSREEPAPPSATPADQSLLARALGAPEAARLRARYADLLQRITRRARTPEDRDRLAAAAERLNPDEWPDEASVRAAASTVDAAWEAIAAELPARRRGRRGGRRRHPGAAAEGAADPSAIMTEDGDIHAASHDEEPAGADWPGGDRGDGDPDGSGGELESPGDRLQGDD